MKKRNFVYLLAFILTLALAVPALADTAPDPPETTATSLTLEAVTTAPGDFTVTAVLEDDQGNKLDGQDLEFSFGKDTDDDGQLETVIDTGGIVTTDGSGYAEYTFNEDTEGDYDYRVYFASTETYDYTMDTAAVTVTGAEVRTVSSSKKDHSGCQVKGRHSLSKSEQSPPPGGKRKSCVLIHTSNRPRRCL